MSEPKRFLSRRVKAGHFRVVPASHSTRALRSSVCIAPFFTGFVSFRSVEADDFTHQLTWVG